MADADDAQRMITVQIPESLAREAQAHWPSLSKHPAASGYQMRYSAACAVRAAVRVALAEIDRPAGE